VIWSRLASAALTTPINQDPFGPRPAHILQKCCELASPKPETLVRGLDPLAVEDNGSRFDLVRDERLLGRGKVEMADDCPIKQHGMITIHMPAEICRQPPAAVTERIRPGCGNLGHAAKRIFTIIAQ
jgi:hypothetical protein